MRLAVAVSMCLWMSGCNFDAGSLGTESPSSETGTSSGTPATSGSATLGSTSVAGGSSSSTGTPPLDTGATIGPPPGTTTEGTSGSSSEGGSSSGTGPMTPLVDTGLLARWFVDEDSRGQAPGNVLDAVVVPSAFDLPLLYPDDVMEYDVLDGNRGLRWTATDNDGRAVRPIAGTKIDDLLDGASRATIELVIAVDAVSMSHSRFFHIGEGDASDFIVGSVGMNRLDIRWGGNQTIRSFMVNLSSSRQVIHVVIDTTQAVPEDRIRAYRDGDPLPINSMNGSVPSQGDGLPLTNDASLTLGNRTNGSRSFQGHLTYAALYTEPLNFFEVSQNADVLGLDDDAP